MASRNANVVNSHFRLVASTHVKGTLLSWKAQDMYCSRSVLLQRQGFHHYKVSGGRLLYLHQFIDSIVHFKEIGVSLLANFALKDLPVHWDEVHRFCFFDLGAEPISETVKMDETDTPRTLAWNNAGVIHSGFAAPAKATLAFWMGMV